MSNSNNNKSSLDTLRSKAKNLLEECNSKISQKYSDIIDIIDQLKKNQSNNDELLNTSGGITQESLPRPVNNQEFYDSIPCPYIILNSEGIITLCNVYAAKLFDMSQKTLISKSLDDFIAKETLQEYLDSLNKTTKNIDKETKELKLIRHDGSFLWVRAEFSTKLSKNGKIYQHHLTLTDITDLKSDLRSKHSHYSNVINLIELNTDGIIVVDSNGIILFTNPEAENLFNQKKESLIGEKFGFPESNEEKTEVKIFPKNKMPIILEMQTQETIWNDKEAVIAVFRDITDRKKIEHYQKEAHEFWKSTIDALTSHMAILDEETNILDVNYAWKQFADNYGLSMANYGIGSNYLQVTKNTRKQSAKEADEAIKGIQKLLNEDINVFELEYSLVVNKEEKWFRLRGTKFKSSYGKRIVLNHINITEEKQYEKALNKNQQELSLIYKNIPLLIMLVDKDCEIQKANAFVSKFANKETENLIGQKTGETLRCINYLNSPKGCGYTPYCKNCTIRNSVKDTYETGNDNLMQEATLPCYVNGEKVYYTFLISTSLLRLREKPLVLITIQDITDRKRRINALQESEERFKALFNSLKDAVFLHPILPDNQVGTFEQVNEAACNILGYTHEEFQNMTPEGLSLNQHSNEFVPSIVKEINKKGYAVFEDIQYTKEGKAIQVEVNANFTKIQDEPYIISVVRDITERKEKEKALQESEERFRTLFNNLTDGVFLHRILNNKEFLPFEEVNKAATEMFGYTEEEFKHMTPEDFHVYEDSSKDFMAEAIQKSYEEGNIVFEEALYTKSGEIIQAEINSSVTEIQGVPYSISVVRDITERREKEKALRESEHQLSEINKALVNLGADSEENIQNLTTLCGKLLEADYAMFNLIQEDKIYTLGQWNLPGTDPSIGHNAIGTPCYDIIYSQKYENFIIRNVDSTNYAKEGSFITEHGIKTYMGHPIRCRGQFIGAICTLFQKDINPSENIKKLLGIVAGAIGTEEERRRAETNLRNTQNLLLRAEEMANIGSWQLDPNTDKAYWSDQVYRIFGLKPQEFNATYEAFIQTVHPEDRKKVEENFKNSLKNSEDSTEFEHRIIRKDNEEIRALFQRCENIKDKDGSVIKSEGMLQDVTEIRQMQEAEREAKRAAQEANQAKTDFLANMSHELRTPLNSVIGFADLLYQKSHGNLNDKQLRYAKNISKSARHLLDLLNDLLDLSKIEANKMTLECSDIKVESFIKDTIDMLKQKATQHNIDIKSEIPDKLTNYVIYADQRKLRQIMFNLLSNATKFTPDGGNITVKADLITSQNQKENTKNMLQVSVSDSGKGIAPENQKYIFERFTQADTKSGSELKGTGLGLSLTKRLVELHKGQIFVESKGEGKGSTFTFQIPTIQSKKNKD